MDQWIDVGICDSSIQRDRRPPSAACRRPGGLSGNNRHNVTFAVLLGNSQIHPSHDPSRDASIRHKIWPAFDA